MTAPNCSINPAGWRRSSSWVRCSSYLVVSHHTFSSHSPDDPHSLPHISSPAGSRCEPLHELPLTWTVRIRLYLTAEWTQILKLSSSAISSCSDSLPLINMLMWVCIVHFCHFYSALSLLSNYCRKLYCDTTKPCGCAWLPKATLKTNAI